MGLAIKALSNQGSRKNLNTLSYILAGNKIPITLNLYEAERYAPAVIVQQLIGNLVYYSNNGRYEPRISESWQRVSPTRWDFKIKKGYTCENGEEISATSFKKSLIRSFKAAAKKGNVPVFNKLEGFSDLINGNINEFPGIIVVDDILSFRFTESTRSGPLQLLSFAPFGYICEENLNPDLSWKDDSKFISSGAYKIEKIEIGKEYILAKRKEWIDSASKSPERVIISHDIPTSEKEVERNTIIDSLQPLNSLPSNLKNYPLVPEYMCGILLGNIKDGFFSKLENRRALDNAVQVKRESYPNKQPSTSYSPFFYPSQQRLKQSFPKIVVSPPKKPLVIEGKELDVTNPKYAAYKILIDALESLGWKYVMKNNEFTWKDHSDPNYDIRIAGTSVGSGVEAWGLDMFFFSPVGPNLPDPSGRVKKMLEKYDADKLTEQELTDQFITTVEEDSAIFPISHFGLQWYISSGVNTKSISPLISVIRFDQVEIE